MKLKRSLFVLKFFVNAGCIIKYMSGHNKWSKVKGKKEITDKKKGQLYTYFARKITAAVREEKGVSQIVDQARMASVPKHVIDRAIAKATPGTQNLKTVIFEGFLDEGKINVIICAETDNNSRTSNQIKNVFEKHGGKMGSQGSVMHLFSQAGRLYIPNTKENIDLILESPANDYFEEGDEIRIETDVSHLKNVVDFFEEKNIVITGEEIVYEPFLKVEIDENEKMKYDNFVASLNLIEDVTAIYSNVED